MKLLIRRDQKTGLLGKQKYTLYVRAQLTDVEAALVHKNRLEGELLLYFDKDANLSGSTLARSFKDGGGFIGLAVRHLRDVALTVAKLIEGATFTCDNVGELLSVEHEAVRGAMQLKRYINAASTFGGEEAIDIDEALKQEDEG